MKKVLFIGTTDFNLDDHNKTLEKKYLGLSESMEVFVLARGKSGDYKKYNSNFSLVARSFGKPGMILWLFKAFFKARKIIKENKIDTIIAQSPAMDGVLSAVVKKIYKVELVVEAHGDWIGSPFLYFKLPFEGTIKKALVAMGKISLKNADKVRGVSGYTDALVRQYAPKDKKFFVFNTFSDIEIFQKERDISYEKYIYYAGWLYKLKGLHILIKAFLKIEKKHPDFKIIITGEGPYIGELKEIAQGNEKIIFTGWKEQEEVKEMMRKCWAYALPSFSEGFPRVLIEAAMLKKAMIGSNAGGIPDMIKDSENGFLFEPGNVDELAEKLDKIMGDKELTVRMGESGRRMVEDKFSLERYFKAYREMIYG